MHRLQAGEILQRRVSEKSLVKTQEGMQGKSS
jgi:hypothetical protein